MSELPAATDVAIIGGGFAGAATAWALAKRGIKPLVLEREANVGRFASGRSAGLGRQLAEDDATTQLTVRGAQLLRSELAATWRPTGGILTFDQPRHAETYTARAQQFAVAIERIDAASVVARWPGADVFDIRAALLVPSDGVIDVARLLALYLAGIEVVCDARVESIEPGPRGARLATARGTLDARLVVDATGAWAGELTGDPPLDAFKRHVYMLEATAAPELPFLWHLGANELYVRGDAQGLLVSPCDACVTMAADQQPDPIGLAALRAKLAESLWNKTPIARQWACQRAFTQDRAMRLGRDPKRPWLVWAAGLGGHGATASPAVGETVAAACLEALA